MTCEWDVTRRLSSVVRRPYVVPVPYSTCVSPGSFVVQLIVTRVDFADAAGWEMTGPVVSRAPFATVTVTPADVLTFPAASRATAVRTCEPSAIVAELQVVAYGGVVISTPRFAPSILSWTPATPMLSLALADRVTVPVTVAPAAGAVTATVGGVESLRVAPPLIPEIVTVLDVVTALVATANVAVVLPAGTVTLPGTVATAVLLLDRVTTAPPAGAAALRVTVPVDVPPPPTLVGRRLIDVSVGVPGVTEAARIGSRHRRPEIVTVVDVVTALFATANVAVVPPAGTVTLPVICSPMF
jgi:hypothetical protein